MPVVRLETVARGPQTIHHEGETDLQARVKTASWSWSIGVCSTCYHSLPVECTHADMDLKIFLFLQLRFKWSITTSNTPLIASCNGECKMKIMLTIDPEHHVARHVALNSHYLSFEAEFIISTFAVPSKGSTICDSIFQLAVVVKGLRRFFFKRWQRILFSHFHFHSSCTNFYDSRKRE